MPTSSSSSTFLPKLRAPVTNALCRPYVKFELVTAAAEIGAKQATPLQEEALLSTDEQKVSPAADPIEPLSPYTPDILRQIYHLPEYATPTKRRVTVAIVIAYLHRTIDGSASMSKSSLPYELRNFCSYHRLKPPTFLSPITLGNSIAPLSFPTGGPFFIEAAPAACRLDPYDRATTPGWPLEASLDVQWLYSACNKTDGPASGPNIILVHSKSPSFTDMSLAVKQAVALGADEVSMSWGSAEFAGETFYDSYFSSGRAGAISFLASTGDNSFGCYPAFSPYVIAIGGTQLRVSENGARLTEAAWGNIDGSGNGGGGVSGDNSGPANSTLPVQVKVPPYQSGLGYKGRSIPDFSAFASSDPGVLVFLNQYVAPRTTPSTVSLQYAVGGTSLSAPFLAGLLANANQLRLNNSKTVLSSNQVLTALYRLYNNSTSDSYCAGYIHNITAGATYLYTETVTTVGTGRSARKVSTWSYKEDNSAAPVSTSKGYDCATGLGVPGPGLTQFLASL